MDLTPPVGGCPDCTNGEQCAKCSRGEWAGLESSAPVGVPADILRIVGTAIDVCNDRDRPAMAEDLEAVRLYVEQASAPLAQQPAADTLADTQRAIIEAAERRGYERAMSERPATVDKAGQQ